MARVGRGETILTRSSYNGNGECQAGNSHANGNVAPFWLRGNWEYAEVRASQYSSWTVMA